MSKRSSPLPSSPARHSMVTRVTAFDSLPDYLSRDDLKRYLGISIASADSLIKHTPHRRFGKHVRVSKYLLEPQMP